VNLDPQSARALQTPAEEIYGVVCRVQAGEVEASVPPHFKVAAATEVAVAYVRELAAEMMRLPHRYGYDPQTAYTVLVQTWDTAVLPTPSLAFGRDVEGHRSVGLIPDAYYVAERGYANLHTLGLRTPAWSRRSATLAWRGSVTGQGPFAAPEDIPRIKLALACRDMAGVDVALIGVHETMGDVLPGLADFVRREGLLAPRWPKQNFCYYRYALDIDGHANAWGLLEKLILGCCVLKVATSLEQWFYPRMHAWEHYVPVAADLSDLGEALDWCRANEAECEWIADNGRRLAATTRWQAELARSCMEFMKVARANRV
jgi:hypothetical protein